MFVPTFKSNQRTRMINKESILKGEPEFCLNVIDRYTSRPSTPLFENICLYEFAAMYQPAYKQDYADNSDIEEDFPEEVLSHQKIKLLNDKGFLKRRAQSAVVRYAYFNPIQDPEKYYYSLLLLYLPFREENFIHGHASSMEAFQQLHSRLRTAENNSIININFSLELDRAIAVLAENMVQAENESSIPEIPSQQVSGIFEERDEPDYCMPTDIPPVAPMNHMQDVQGLSSEQRQVFNEITNAISSGKKGVRVVAMGSGGVGTFLHNGQHGDYFENCDVNSRKKSSHTRFVPTHSPTDCRNY